MAHYDTANTEHKANPSTVGAPSPQKTLWGLSEAFGHAALNANKDLVTSPKVPQASV